MTFQQELASWNPFAATHQVNPVPEVGDSAPSRPELQIPRPDKKRMIVTFLRHCGCPCMLFQNPTIESLLICRTVAEKMFKIIRDAAEQNPGVHFVAVSHSDQNATSNWLKSVGGRGAVEVIVDDERQLFGAYGLGLSSFWHALNPWSMASVVRLGRSEKIWNRPTESGSRWQTAGMFGINEKGYFEYVHIAQAADDLGDFDEALICIKR